MIRSVGEPGARSVRSARDPFLRRALAWTPGLFALAGSLPFAFALAARPNPASAKAFETDVLPIFKAHCFQCHGKDVHMGGLRLDSLGSVLKGGVTGKAVVSRKSAGSFLVTRIEGRGGKPQMPMGFKPLSADKIATIRAWIDQGAKGKSGSGTHWAYIKPVRPSVPTVSNAQWVRNPIDAFVLARLRKEGLKPSAQASKEALIRRVSLDIIGLPPTIKEIDAFLDDKSPNAYEKVVDRLLASSHYGERQARIWLDLSRYADSDGYEKDLNRIAWKYRDWLINAFNRNLRYDRFVIEQMAGDLFPNRTLEQRVATGFHRNSMLNLEGGVDQAEATFEVQVDRLGTTGSVFLGSTIQCSRCHDHKYDPFKQKDFYRMLAFFSNPVIIPQGDANVGEEKWVEPIIEVPSPAQTQKRANLRMAATALERQLKIRTPDLIAAQKRWEGWAKESAVWVGLVPIEAKAQSGAELRVLPDAQVQAFGPVPERDLYTLKFSLAGREICGIRLQTLPGDELPNRGPGRADNGNFVIAKIEIKVDGKPVMVRLSSADFEQIGFPIRNAFDSDGNSGWAISPKLGTEHFAVLELAEPIPASAKELEVVLDQRSGYLKHVLGKFRISGTSSQNPAMREVSPDIRAILDNPDRKAQEQSKLDAYYASIAPSLEPGRARLAQAKKDLSELQKQIPTALVLQDKPANGPLTAYFHTRGEFLNVGEKLVGGTPGFLPPMPKSAPVNRLGFSRWIVGKENPLTARVQVNRMWAQYFGRGIVETEEDFGTQCSPPTHPELLDWLATELMATNWDLKAIHKLIVTSAAYCQSSNSTAALLAKDPENRLLARGPRFRLEAETLRDNALAAAGILSLKVGGPSVYPVQPEGVWNIPYNGENWMTSEGENRYRRGLYTFWKRTSPYPAFTNFDASSRESCTVRRIRTNTPVQALTLLNDPAFMDAARGLAKRMMKEAKPFDSARVELGFRLATGRGPTKPESERMLKLLAEMRAKYAKYQEAAKMLAGDSESAAWTMVANVLLNLDETITKG